MLKRKKYKRTNNDLLISEDKICLVVGDSALQEHKRNKNRREPNGIQIWHVFFTVMYNHSECDLLGNLNWFILN
jgi:predicted solute-binding protein